MKEIDNVLRILKEAKAAIAKEDNIRLKELSNETIHTASTSQDPDNIAIAVIVYSLSKIIERPEYKKQKGWGKFYKKIMSSIQDCFDALKDEEESKLHDSLNRIRKAIDELSGKLKKYIQDVFYKASINKASKIYEHGISMEKTADLLGVTLYELASYAGQKSEISEIPEVKTSSVKWRIKRVMEMFE